MSDNDLCTCGHREREHRPGDHDADYRCRGHVLAISEDPDEDPREAMCLCNLFVPAHLDRTAFA